MGKLIDRLSEALGPALTSSVGHALVGVLILIVGNFLGTLAYTRLKAGSSTAVANIARVAILGLVLAMGLKAMGLADQIVNMAFGFTIGSVAVAAALASASVAAMRQRPSPTAGPPV